MSKPEGVNPPSPVPEANTERQSVTNSGEAVEAKEVTRRDNKTQPWKAHWPPKEGTALDPAYGFEKGKVIKI